MSGLLEELEQQMANTVTDSLDVERIDVTAYESALANMADVLADIAWDEAKNVAHNVMSKTP